MSHGVPTSGFEFKKFKLPLNPRSTGIVVRCVRNPINHLPIVNMYYRYCKFANSRVSRLVARIRIFRLLMQ